MATEKYNTKSDKQFRVTLKTLGGTVVDPTTMWAKIHLRCGGRKFVAVNDPNEERKNCHLDSNGRLVVDIPGDSLNAGILEYMVEVRDSNEYFSDGYKNTFPLAYTKTNIEYV